MTNVFLVSVSQNENERRKHFCTANSSRKIGFCSPFLQKLSKVMRAWNVVLQFSPFLSSFFWVRYDEGHQFISHYAKYLSLSNPLFYFLVTIIHTSSWCPIYSIKIASSFYIQTFILLIPLFSQPLFLSNIFLRSAEFECLILPGSNDFFSDFNTFLPTNDVLSECISNLKNKNNFRTEINFCGTYLPE